MDWNNIAPMLVAITLILTTGGVLVLRPLSKKLGSLLEVMTQQRGVAAPQQELVRMRELLERMEGRIALLEERQAFAESLLAAKQAPPSLASGASEGAPPLRREG